jgi:hypothetical protein
LTVLKLIKIIMATLFEIRKVERLFIKGVLSCLKRKLS